jgi:hypothetical protein
MSGKQPEPEIDAPSAKPRKPPAPTGIPLEADVQRAIIDYIKVHPNVLMAWRVNSGAAHTESGAPIWFYRLIKCPGEFIRLPDIIGLMKDGRMFAIEVKRPGWKRASNQREIEQENFLQAVALNGLAGFATSIEDAASIFGGSKRHLPIKEK